MKFILIGITALALAGGGYAMIYPTLRGETTEAAPAPATVAVAHGGPVAHRAPNFGTPVTDILAMCRRWARQGLSTDAMVDRIARGGFYKAPRGSEAAARGGAFCIAGYEEGGGHVPAILKKGTELEGK